jgi:hypothetical protein
MQLRVQPYPDEARRLTPGTFGLAAELPPDSQRYLKWLGARRPAPCLEYHQQGAICLECTDGRGESWARHQVESDQIWVVEASDRVGRPGLVLLAQAESVRRLRQESDRLIDWFLEAGYTTRAPGYAVWNLLATEDGACRAHLERNVAPYYDVVEIEGTCLAQLRFPTVLMSEEGEP